MSEAKHALLRKIAGSARLHALLLGVVTAVANLLFQSRIAIRDVDAYSYIVGAQSIRAGRGYVNLLGEPLNHWPPGYSFILSLFPDPLVASRIINCLAAGAAVAFIYLLARRNHWGSIEASSVSVIFGVGFFRVIASNATPDALTYSTFLLGALQFTSERPSRHLVAYLLWAALIPIKAIAVVFVPAALLTSWKTSSSPRPKQLKLSSAIGVLAWALALVWLSIYNVSTIGKLAPDSHELPSFESLLGAVPLFIYTLVRSFMLTWYGSISPIPVLIMMGMALVIAVLALRTLRFRSGNRRILALGVGTLILSFLLQLVRAFGASARLMGYGLLVALLAARTTRRSTKWWPIFAIFSLLIGLTNLIVAPDLGANDPRYEIAAARAATMISRDDEPVASNAFHILDIHQGIASVYVRGATEQGNDFIYFDLPNFGAVSSIVWPHRPPGEWCEERRVPEVELLRRCEP